VLPIRERRSIGKPKERNERRDDEIENAMEYIKVRSVDF
jgi:hypothetical protein